MTQKSLVQLLKDTTLFFPCGTPNLPAVIPAMDHIDSKFTLPANQKHPTIRAAVAALYLLQRLGPSAPRLSTHARL
jgi:hypothetical protein